MGGEVLLRASQRGGQPAAFGSLNSGVRAGALRFGDPKTSERSVETRGQRSRDCPIVFFDFIWPSFDSSVERVLPRLVVLVWHHFGLLTLMATLNLQSALAREGNERRSLRGVGNVAEIEASSFFGEMVDDNLGQNQQ